MSRTISVVLVALAVIAAAGPAGAKTHHHPKTKVQKSKTTAAAKYYLAIVAPSNAAAATINGELGADGTTIPTATVAKQVAPVIAALGTFDTKLTTYTWPPQARADVKSLLSADAALIGALQSVSGVTSYSASTWETTVSSDQQESGVDADEVRHDLGLPPASKP